MEYQERDVLENGAKKKTKSNERVSERNSEWAREKWRCKN